MRDLTDESLTDQLSRERLLDMEARLAHVRRQAFAVLALALIAAGPWIGFQFLVPLFIAGVGFAIADRRVRRSPRPERWAAAGWALAPLIIAVCAAVTGAAESPALMWLALPVTTLGARFEPRGVRLGVAWTIALLLAVTVGLDSATVLEHPEDLIFPFALIISMAILGGAALKSEREHRRVAVIDPLTGLLNRSAFAQRLGELQHQIDQGAESSLGFLMADIDHFKRINDEHGHPVGDAVLRDVAYAMRSELRAFDLDLPPRRRGVRDPAAGRRLREDARDRRAPARRGRRLQHRRRLGDHELRRGRHQRQRRAPGAALRGGRRGAVRGEARGPQSRRGRSPRSRVERRYEFVSRPPS